MKAYYPCEKCLHSLSTPETESIVFTNDEINDDDIEQYTNLLRFVSTTLDKSMELWVVFKKESRWGFNSIEKHHGIWRQLKEDGIAFRNCLDEYLLKTPVGEIIQTAARIELSEIPFLFQLQNSYNSIWFWTPSICSDDRNEIIRNIDGVQISAKELLSENAIIIDYLDYASEGNSLFLNAKKGNCFMKVIMDRIKDERKSIIWCRWL